MRNFETPKGIRIEEETPTYGRYTFMPLERGYGITVGNALRRVLLSSIQGAAIIALRIEGVPHEFSALPGVLEDIPDIVLNLKKVRFRFNAPEDMVTAYIRKSGTGEVTAGDIEVPGELEVVNPDQHIATLTKDDARLYAELVVARGWGYLPIEDIPKQPFPSGYIFVDGIFSPVTKVNFTVENIRVKERTDFERLNLEIWTDGTRKPWDVLQEAAQILLKHFELVTIPTKAELEKPEQDYGERERMKAMLLKDLDVLELKVRTASFLKEQGIQTIADLVAKTPEELLKIKNFGEKSLQEVEEKLRQIGLKLGMDVSKYLKEIEDEAQEEG